MKRDRSLHSSSLVILEFMSLCSAFFGGVGAIVLYRTGDPHELNGGNPRKLFRELLDHEAVETKFFKNLAFFVERIYQLDVGIFL